MSDDRAADDVHAADEPEGAAVPPTFRAAARAWAGVWARRAFRWSVKPVV